jgi:hypothetical protein
MQTSKLHPQYVRGYNDEPLGVFLTIAEYQGILDELEELEDIKVVDAFERREDKEFVPFHQALMTLRED